MDSEPYVHCVDNVKQSDSPQNREAWTVEDYIAFFEKSRKHKIIWSVGSLLQTDILDDTKWHRFYTGHVCLANNISGTMTCPDQQRNLTDMFEMLANAIVVNGWDE
jgi:hypothetical protein